MYYILYAWYIRPPNSGLLDISSFKRDYPLGRWTAGSKLQEGIKKGLFILVPYELCENIFLNICTCYFYNKRKQANKKFKN